VIASSGLVSLSVEPGPFMKPWSASGKVGEAVIIVGNNLTRGDRGQLLNGTVKLCHDTELSSHLSLTRFIFSPKISD
jgi:hypothetical protein